MCPFAGAAVQACLPCRKGKRKCDKGLPDCSLCKKVGRICRYESSSSEQNGETPTLLPILMFNISQLTPASAEETVIKQALNILGNETNTRNLMTRYFNTVHTWFPIISPTCFHGRHPQVGKEPTAECSLLSLSMLLLTMEPEALELSSRMRSIYVMIKSSMGTLEAIGANSLELLQCRVLVTLFEVVHGMYPAAYVSIGTAARAGIVMSIYETYRTEPTDQRRDDEAKSVWRGITILDRQISLDYGHGPCVTRGIGSAGEAVGEGSSLRHLGEVASPLEHFLQLSQASDLLDKVLLHVNNPTPHHDFNSTEATQLLKTINSFQVVLQQNPALLDGIGSGAISVCNSALIALYNFGRNMTRPGNENCASCAVELLDGAIREVVKTVKSLKISLEMNGLRSISPFILHSIYKAAATLKCSLQSLRTTERQEQFEILEDTLKIMGRRWLAAERYLKLLEENGITEHLSDAWKFNL